LAMLYSAVLLSLVRSRGIRMTDLRATQPKADLTGQHPEISVPTLEECRNISGHLLQSPVRRTARQNAKMPKHEPFGSTVAPGRACQNGMPKFKFG